MILFYNFDVNMDLVPICVQRDVSVSLYDSL
jgi:hypothetical protein